MPGSFFYFASMTIHQPVLAHSVEELLRLAPGMTVVDGTFGGGGHTRLLSGSGGASGHVLALDRDPQAVLRGSQMGWPAHVQLRVANYIDLPQILDELSIDWVDGILLDLGLSSDQLADYDRGFSFQSEGVLDMRFDPSSGEPAWQLVNRLDPESLANLIYKFGEERCSRRIARRIFERRGQHPIRTAKDLAELVRKCVPRSRHNKIDPATRTFQALRIAVNDELGCLEAALERLLLD